MGNKAPLGPRLQRVTDALVYKKKTSWRGPKATTASLWQKPSGQWFVKVTFDSESVGDGISLRASSCPVDLAKCGWWNVLPANGDSYNVSATVQSTNSLLLSIPGALGRDEVRSVRYLWADWPAASLYNSHGLPGTPFDLQVLNLSDASQALLV